MSRSPASPVTPAAAHWSSPVHWPRLTVDKPSVYCLLALKRPRLFGKAIVRKGSAAGAGTAPLAASCGRRLAADGRPGGSRAAACAGDVSNIERAPRAREEVAVALPAAHVGQQAGRAGCACASVDSLSLARPGALKASSNGKLLRGLPQGRLSQVTPQSSGAHQRPPAWLAAAGTARGGTPRPQR